MVLNHLVKKKRDGFGVSGGVRFIQWLGSLGLIRQIAIGIILDAIYCIDALNSVVEESDIIDKIGVPKAVDPNFMLHIGQLARFQRFPTFIQNIP